MKKHTQAKNLNNNHDTAANNIHTINNMKSAKTVKIRETNQPNDCLI